MLKADRRFLDTDISFFMNETAVRGGVVSLSTAGSGAALDQAAALATYAANPSGLAPLGILVGDMVNYDATRQRVNYLRDETLIGGKICILKKGWVVTNSLMPGITPNGGDVAYVDNSGLIGAVSPANAATFNFANKPRIGRFLSKKEEEGYAKVEVNL